MDIKTLTDQISVSGQIGKGDLSEIADAGFTAVINNRPDGEMFGQPSGAVIEAAAQSAGLSYTSIPISGPPGEDAIEAFAAALEAANGPVLAYCRSGTRSTMVWALSQAAHTDPDTLIATAAEAGYDLSSMRPLLESRHAR